MVEYCLDVLVSVFHFDISVQLNCFVKVRRVYTSLLYSSRMFVCGLSPPERLDRLGCTVYRYLRLGPGKVLGKKNSRSIHGFAGNPGKTGFYSISSLKCAWRFLVIRNFYLHCCTILFNMAARSQIRDPIGKNLSFIIVCIIENMLFNRC